MLQFEILQNKTSLIFSLFSAGKKSMMSSELRPSTSIGDLQLHSTVKNLHVDTDFTSCIICQKGTGKLYNVTPASLPSLKRAMCARQATVSERLSAIIHTEMFLQDNEPKWHPRCRNTYLLKSSYELAKRKRNEALKSKQSSGNEDNQFHNSMTKCSMSPQFDSKKHCIICCRTYPKGKKPTSFVKTKEQQFSLQQKAKDLNDEALLLRI